MELSILICSTDTRLDNFLLRSYKMLNEQAKQYAGVEVLALVDNKRRTVGQKRNDLIAIANGKYVAFVDDDDIVEPDYIQELLQQTKEGTDVICFGARRYVNGVHDRDVKYGVQFRKDSDTPGLYYRIPNHLMCFKRDLACEISYDDISCGEDSAWAKKMLYKIKTQTTINKVLYHYYFSPQTTETQK